MTLAIVLVIAAALALVSVSYFAVSTSLKVSPGASLSGNIRPLDVEAFRNLVDPAESDYLRRRLPPAEYRLVQRKRLLAIAAYVRVAGQNATVLIEIGDSACASSDARTAEAARQMRDNAVLLKSNATFALLRIYAALAWPGADLSPAPILHGYEKLNGSAMLLGRLQNPSVPVRLSATS